MSRYWLFAGSRYYPGGGWHDFHDFFNTLEEAIAASENVAHSTPWFHILDTEEGRVVWDDYGEVTYDNEKGR